MRRPRVVNKQHEVYAFYVSIYQQTEKQCGVAENPIKSRRKKKNMTYAEAKDEFDKLNKLGGPLTLKRCICTPHLIVVDFERFYVKPDGFDHFVLGVPPFKRSDLGFDITPEVSQILEFESLIRRAKQISNGDWATSTSRGGLFFMEISSHFPSANIDLRDYIKFKSCDSSDFQSRDLTINPMSDRPEPTDEYAPEPDFEYPDWICTGMQRIYYLHDTLIPQIIEEEKKEQQRKLRQRILDAMTEEERNNFLEEERRQEEEKHRKEEAKKAEQKRIATEKKKEKEKRRLEEAKKEEKRKAAEKAAEEVRKKKQKKTNMILWLSWLGLSIFFLFSGDTFDYEWWHYILIVLAIIVAAVILLYKKLMFDD